LQYVRNLQQHEEYCHGALCGVVGCVSGRQCCEPSHGHHPCVLQCVAVCCSVLQCVAVCSLIMVTTHWYWSTIIHTHTHKPTFTSTSETTNISSLVKNRQPSLPPIDRYSSIVIHMHIHAYTHTHTHARMHTRTHARTRTRTHAHTHTHTHTHTH